MAALEDDSCVHFRWKVALERRLGAERLDESTCALRRQHRANRRLFELSCHDAAWSPRLSGRHLLLCCVSRIPGLLLVDENIGLHLTQVHIVIKLNNVLRLTTFIVDNALLIDLLDIAFELEELSVLRDDVVEGDLAEVTDFDYRVNCAHQDLVQVPVDEQMWLARQHGLDQVPDDLLVDVWNLQQLTQLVRCDRR